MADDRIFSEVDEELRSARMSSLWRRFGPWLIGAAVLMVVLVGANEGWRWFKDNQAATSSDQFYSAMQLLDDGDLFAANEALNLTIATGSGEYPALARFTQASILAEEGKIDEAVAAYDALANTGNNTRMRELALLLAASILVDSGDIVGVQTRLAGLLSPDNPYYGSARETLGLTFYKSGDLEAAQIEFAAVVASPITPIELLNRVQLYQAQLQAEGAPIPDELDQFIAQ